MTTTADRWIPLSEACSISGLRRPELIGRSISERLQSRKVSSGEREYLLSSLIAMLAEDAEFAQVMLEFPDRQAPLEVYLAPFRKSGRRLKVIQAPRALFTMTDELPSPPWPDIALEVLSCLNMPAGLDHDARMAWHMSRPPLEDVLQIGLVLALIDDLPVLDQHHDWQAIHHQTAGVSIGIVSAVVLRLDIRPEIAAALLPYAVETFGSDLGRGRPTPEEVDAYRAALAPLDLVCEASVKHLQEGFYPVDLPGDPVAAQALVDHLADNAPRLAELGGEPKPTGGFLGDAILGFICANSD